MIAKKSEAGGRPLRRQSIRFYFYNNRPSFGRLTRAGRTLPSLTLMFLKDEFDSADDGFTC